MRTDDGRILEGVKGGRHPIRVKRSRTRIRPSAGRAVSTIRAATHRETLLILSKPYRNDRESASGRCAVPEGQEEAFGSAFRERRNRGKGRIR